MKKTVDKLCPWCGAKGRVLEGVKPGAACSNHECPLYTKWFFLEQWEGRGSGELENNLRELLCQWRESRFLIAVIDSDGAAAYGECIRELEQIMAGDLRPIEPV